MNIILQVQLYILAIVAVNTAATTDTTTTTTADATPNNDNNNDNNKAQQQQQHHKPTKNNILPTSDDYRVYGLENIEPAFQQFRGIMYAGLIPTTTTLYETSNDNKDTNTHNNHKSKDNSGRNTEKQKEDGALMFWLYAPTNPTYTDTLLIWLNGGPGCSSCTYIHVVCVCVCVFRCA
jgi:Serine carboxypeptidase